ncbi:hypothetical protein KBD33_03010 [Candidatus Gracilibacteria bacterium]|nr:hypothetical protein [Candidatus Gracilibacteria bacterium]
MYQYIQSIQGIYYLRIIPGTIGENQLINSIKSDLNAFHIRGIWFGIENYLYKNRSSIKLEQYICSNSLEGIGYIMNFLIKLYASKISFSLKIKKGLLQYKKYIYQHRIGLNNHSTLQIKKLGAIGGESFATSSSIHGSIFQELASFMNENEIIKTSFYFSRGEYSSIYKDFLFSQKTKSMTEKEQESFESSFSENQNMFLFRWSISHNLKFQDTKSIISKNLSLYSSIYNSYQMKNRDDFWNYIPEGKRLLQPEAILSQGLFVPINNQFSENRKSEIILPNRNFFKENLIIPKKSFI